MLSLIILLWNVFYQGTSSEFFCRCHLVKAVSIHYLDTINTLEWFYSVQGFSAGMCVWRLECATLFREIITIAAPALTQECMSLRVEFLLDNQSASIGTLRFNGGLLHEFIWSIISAKTCGWIRWEQKEFVWSKNLNLQYNTAAF